MKRYFVPLNTKKPSRFIVLIRVNLVKHPLGLKKQARTEADF